VEGEEREARKKAALPQAKHDSIETARRLARADVDD
jgi:hypothetical protein